MGYKYILHALLNILILLISTACADKKSDISKNDCIEELKNDSLNIVLLIPEVGCGNCIASGIEFLKSNEKHFSKEQKSNVVIFTAIHSMKMVNRTLAQYNINKNNINAIFDLENKYSLKGHNKLYPIVYYFDNGNLTKIEEQSPNKPKTLENLHSFLNK